MSKSKADLLHGSLDHLILRTLSLDSMHGWAIAKHISQVSENVLEVGQGSLYPALYRLEDRGWIKARWGSSQSGRKAKFYMLTKAGERRLAEENHEWMVFRAAVDRVLGLT